MTNRIKLGAVLVAAGIFATHAFGIGQGTRELGVSGDFSFTDELAVDLSYGYFVTDEVEVLGGVLVDWTDTGDEDVTAYGIRGAIDYHFTQMQSEAMLPYVEGRAGWFGVDTDGPADDDAFTAGVGVGVKYMLADNVALNSGLFFDWASEDVFFDEGDAEDTEVSIEVGLNFYF